MTDLESLPARATVLETDILYVVDPVTNTAHKATAAQIARAAGAFVSGAEATQANSTVTLAAVTELSTQLAPGVYRITGLVVWRSAATTTGASFVIRGTGGTVTRNVGHWYHLTTGGAATTGISDQDTAGVATGQMIEGRGWRTNTADPGPVVGVDTANADELAVIEAILTVTATTTLDLMFRSEVAGSAITIQPGTHLKIETVV